MEDEAEMLHKEEGHTYMTPIWEYQRNLRRTANKQNVSAKKDGAECNGVEEAMNRCGEWANG